MDLIAIRDALMAIEGRRNLSAAERALLRAVMNGTATSPQMREATEVIRADIQAAMNAAGRRRWQLWVASREANNREVIRSMPGWLQDRAYAAMISGNDAEMLKIIRVANAVALARGVVTLGTLSYLASLTGEAFGRWADANLATSGGTTFRPPRNAVQQAALDAHIAAERARLAEVERARLAREFPADRSTPESQAYAAESARISREINHRAEIEINRMRAARLPQPATITIVVPGNSPQQRLEELRNIIGRTEDGLFHATLGPQTVYELDDVLYLLISDESRPGFLHVVPRVVNAQQAAIELLIVNGRNHYPENIVATVVPGPFLAKTVRLDKTHYDVYLGGQPFAQFASNSRAKTFAKRLNGALRYMDKNTIGYYQTEAPVGLTQWSSDAADPGNRFNPPLVIAS